MHNLPIIKFGGLDDFASLQWKHENLDSDLSSSEIIVKYFLGSYTSILITKKPI